MTLKRYEMRSSKIGATMEPDPYGDWYPADDVIEHIREQRAEAQREALQWVRERTLSLPAQYEWYDAIEGVKGLLDAGLKQLENGDLIESVRSVND